MISALLHVLLDVALIGLVALILVAITSMVVIIRRSAIKSPQSPPIHEAGLFAERIVAKLEEVSITLAGLEHLARESVSGQQRLLELISAKFGAVAAASAASGQESRALLLTHHQLLERIVVKLDEASVPIADESALAQVMKPILTRLNEIIAATVALDRITAEAAQNQMSLSGSCESLQGEALVLHDLVRSITLPSPASPDTSHSLMTEPEMDVADYLPEPVIADGAGVEPASTSSPLLSGLVDEARLSKAWSEAAERDRIERLGARYVMYFLASAGSDPSRFARDGRLFRAIDGTAEIASFVLIEAERFIAVRLKSEDYNYLVYPARRELGTMADYVGAFSKLFRYDAPRATGEIGRVIRPARIPTQILDLEVVGSDSSIVEIGKQHIDRGEVEIA